MSDFPPDVQAKFDRMILDENMVPEYQLPSPLRREDGSVITNAIEWQAKQRAFWIEKFASCMYGEIPPRPDTMSFEVVAEKKDALNNSAIRREVRIICGMSDGRSHDMLLLCYLPKKAGCPVPAFFGLNFQSNAACTREPDVMLSPLPRYKSTSPMLTDTRATADKRGNQDYRWNFEDIVSRGFATATVHYFDAFPDFPDGFGQSIYKLFKTPDELAADSHPYGAISAWAWAISRAVDYLESVPEIDSRKIIVHGHSRLGKTALWAGANDPRVAMVVSNCSGCGGAALSRRNFGESLEWLLHWRTYWFNAKWRDFIGNEAALPFDQHILIALIAPRLAYVASGTEDMYADPKGEFAAALAASEVYQLFGGTGLGINTTPPPDTPIGNDIGYHIRTGPHDMTPFDWRAVTNFAKKRLCK